MSEKTNGKSPHLTFGVRVPNSGPLATVESMVEVGSGSRSPRLRFDLGSRSLDLVRRDPSHAYFFRRGSRRGGQRESGFLRSDDFTRLSRRTGSFGAPRHRLRRGALPQSAARRQANRHPRRALQRPAGYRRRHRLAVDDQIARIRSPRRQSQTARQNRRRSPARDETDLDHSSVQLRRIVCEF